jgi:uncharacterized protein YcgI (DUF1989 family)
MFERQYGVTAPHPNCLDNLTGALAAWDVPPATVTIPFNAFMNVSVAPDGGGARPIGVDVHRA